MRSRPFETRSRPRFLAATLATLPSMSLFPKAPFDLSVCPSMSLAPSGSIRSLQPSQLYLDHSHCPVLAPATLAALPSTRAIETRLLPSFDSCAPAHLDLSVLPIYVARAPAAPFSPLPTVTLPLSLATCSISLFPSAPFQPDLAPYD